MVKKSVLLSRPYLKDNSKSDSTSCFVLVIVCGVQLFIIALQPWTHHNTLIVTAEHNTVKLYRVLCVFRLKTHFKYMNLTNVYREL